MRCKVSIEFHLSSPDQAKAVAGSLAVDDDKYVRTSARGSVVRAEAEAASPKSMMHTLDDYLACAGVAIKASYGKEGRLPPSP